MRVAVSPAERLPDAILLNTMKVTVTLFGDLRRFLSSGVDGAQSCVLSDGATVADLLGALGMEPGTPLTVGVNGELAAVNTVLPDGADVILVSPMDGG